MEPGSQGSQPLESQEDDAHALPKSVLGCGDVKSGVCLEAAAFGTIVNYSTATLLVDYFGQQYTAWRTGVMPALNFVLCGDFYLFGI